jgi:hypothetical protein
MCFVLFCLEMVLVGAETCSETEQVIMFPYNKSIVIDWYYFVVCLPYYLRFLTLFVVFLGARIGYEKADFIFGDGLFSIC